MSVSDSPRSTRSNWPLTISTLIYSKLLRAYPESLREEHAEEMVTCFKDLCRRELHSRGQRGLTLLWFRTLLELVVTTCRERAGMLTTNAYLPVAPLTAVRWGAICALSGGLLGIGYDIIMNLWHVGMRSWSVPGIYHLMPVAAALFLSLLGLFGIYGTLANRSQRSDSVPGRLAATGAILTLVSLVTLAAGFFMRLWAYAGAEAPSMDPSALNWGSWWFRELQWVVHLGGLLSWATALLLLGLATFRKRMLGALRFVPLVAVMLMFGQQFHDDLVPVLTYSLPFLGSALLGWALLRNAELNGQQELGRGAEHGAT